MSVSNTYKNLRAFIRIDAHGIIIPGSVQFRKAMPLQGVWKELILSQCCDGHGASIITFSNTTASSNITKIKTKDGRINWSGTLANGQQISFNITRSYDESFTVTTSAFSGRTITTSTVQGTGTISTIGALVSNATVITTNSKPNSQYLVVLS
jgi:hypothetical protein